MRERIPVETAHAFVEPFPNRLVRLEAEELAGRVIHVSDPAIRVRDDDPFLDRVEDGLDEPFFLGELEQVILNVLRPDPAEAFDQLIEKTGLHRVQSNRSRRAGPATVDLRNVLWNKMILRFVRVVR